MSGNSGIDTSLHGAARFLQWMLPPNFQRGIDSRRGWEYIRPFWGIWGMTRTTRRVGIVLFQLGGPDSLDAVEPFLYNLFSDPDIIDFPFAKIAREPLARLVAASRTKKVRKLYAAIGGKSPIVEWTHRQAVALEAALRESLDARVFVAMRYWHPFTEEAL